MVYIHCTSSICQENYYLRNLNELHKENIYHKKDKETYAISTILVRPNTRGSVGDCNSEMETLQSALTNATIASPFNRWLWANTWFSSKFPIWSSRFKFEMKLFICSVVNIAEALTPILVLSYELPRTTATMAGFWSVPFLKEEKPNVFSAFSSISRLVEVKKVASLGAPSPNSCKCSIRERQVNMCSHASYRWSPSSIAIDIIACTKIRFKRY